MPILGPASGGKKEYSRVEKAMLVRTGLQFLAEALLPKFLNNFIGRWIVWKLISFLVDKKLVKPAVLQNLKKPLGQSKYKDSFMEGRQASFNELDEIIALCQKELNAQVEDTMDFVAIEAELKNYLCKIWKGQKCADVIKDAFRGLKMTACTDVKPAVMAAAIRAALEDKKGSVSEGTKLAAKIFCPYLQRVLEEPVGYHVEKSAGMVGYDTLTLIRELAKDNDPLEHFAQLTPGRRKRVLIAILCGAKMHADSLQISPSQIGYDLDELAEQIEAVGVTEASALVDQARHLVTAVRPAPFATDDPSQTENNRQDYDYFDVGRGRNQPPPAVKRNPAQNPTTDNDPDISSPAYEGFDLHEDEHYTRPLVQRPDGRNKGLQNSNSYGVEGVFDPVSRRQLIKHGPDDPWSDEFLEKVKQRMEGIYEPSVKITVDEQTQMTSLEDLVVAYAKNWPSVGQYPKQINDQAKPLWDETISAYSDKIKKVARPFAAPDGKKFTADSVAWAYAIILFKRLCAQRGIRPFKSGSNPRVTPGGGTSREPNRDLVRGMLEELGKQAKIEAQRNFETLKRAGLGKRFHKKAKYHDVGRSQGRYYITLVYTFSAGPDFTLKAMVNELGRKDKYHKMSNSRLAFKRLNGRIDIKAMSDPHGFYVTMYLNPQEAEAMMEIDSANESKMTKALKFLARDWAKTGKLKRKK